MKIVCVIPARLAASRFPEKLLASLAGKPVLRWAWQAACRVSQFAQVVVAVDDQKLFDAVQSWGGVAVMTSTSCPSGTQRLIEVMQQGVVQADVWVNWQGDEPFIDQTMIDQLLQSVGNPTEEMWTLRKQIVTVDEIDAPNFAKLVVDARGCALYFSRSPIPYSRDVRDYAQLVRQGVYFKHVGLYAYRTATLQRIAQLPQTSMLEDVEKLEQLRFLEHGIAIRVHDTDREVVGIDTPNDLVRASRRIDASFKS